MSRTMIGRPGFHPSNHHYGEHEENPDCLDEAPHCTALDPDYVEPLDVSTGSDGLVTRVASRWETKDSGARQDYPSGMRRDLQEGKARFDLIFPEGIPYQDQLLTRFAELLERGAQKYGENNWQLANSEEELKRFRASGLRHMIQWACGENDEDHATAVIFNLMAYESTKRKLEAG